MSKNSPAKNWKYRVLTQSGEKIHIHNCGKSPCLRVKSFMREYEQLTKPLFAGETPTDWRQLRTSYFRLSADNGEAIGHPAICLSMIASFERGKGHGSAALVWLCDLADKHGVEIFGEISEQIFSCNILNPYDEDHLPVELPVLSPRQLVAWYRRHGFTVRWTERYPRDLRRKPLQRVKAQAQEALDQ